MGRSCDFDTISLCPDNCLCVLDGAEITTNSSSIGVW